MLTKNDPHRVEKAPRARKLIRDIGWLAEKRHTIRGLIEVDVTRARRRIRTLGQETGSKPSFTAFLVACAGRAVDADKHLHAYRDWRGRLIVFEEVDVATMIEVVRGEKRFPVGHIVRAANHKTFDQISAEIRRVQSRPLERGAARSLHVLGLLPGVARRSILRMIAASPNLTKRMKGTIILSSVGMFGLEGGWGISLPSHTLGLTVGGISNKPVLKGDQLENREVLNLTLDFDHDVVDGAPAARFTRRIKDLIESAQELT